MAKQITTSKKLNDDLFKITIGTVDKKSPKVFYITLTCWASLRNKEIDGEEVIAAIDKQIKSLINSASKSHEFLQNIVCLDCSAEGLNNGKSAYMTIDITLLQNKYSTFSDVYDIATNFIMENYQNIVSIFENNNLKATKNKQHDRVLHKSQVY